MKRWQVGWCSVLCGAVLSWSAEAMAYSLPPVNLGLTNFLDGAPPPGLHYNFYLQYYMADKFTDESSETFTVPFAGGEKLGGKLIALVQLNQLVYIAKELRFLGGSPGLDVIVPVVRLDVESEFLKEDRAGVGDLLVGPFVQWSGMKALGMPFFARMELQNIFPTGEYDDEKAINPGSNFYSFNPYVASTMFFTPSVSASIRFHYLWNAPNHSPGGLFHQLGPSHMQAGQAVHFNWAWEYQIAPMVRAGVAGYYLRQITRDEFNGRNIEELDPPFNTLAWGNEQVFAAGPGGVLHLNPHVSAFATVMFETMAENRTEGVRANLWVNFHF